MAQLLTFQLVGADAAQKAMVALLDKLQDLTPFWRDVWAPKYFAKVQDLFATGGRARGGGGKFKGGAWAPLSPAYRKWKKEHYPGQPILEREGALRESLRWGGQALGAGGKFEAHPGYVVAGTTIPYGKYHMTGTGSMPARPFLPDPDPAEFTQLLLQWLMKVQGPSGMPS